MNHRAERLGVGVVGVVEDCGAPDFEDLAALVACGERGESGDGGVEVHSRFERDGETSHGIDCVMGTEQLQREGTFAFSCPEAYLKAVEIFSGGENLRIGAGSAAEVDDTAREVAAELPSIRVVAV